MINDTGWITNKDDKWLCFQITNKSYDISDVDSKLLRMKHNRKKDFERISKKDFGFIGKR